MVFIMLIPAAEKILDNLSDSSTDFVVIVEGKKDVEALQRLKITRTEMLNRYPGIVDMADAVAEKGVRRAVILTDYDKTGQHLAHRIRTALSSAGVRVNWQARMNLRRVFGITYVENIDQIVDEMKRGDSHGKDIHRFCKVPHSRKY